MANQTPTGRFISEDGDARFGFVDVFHIWNQVALEPADPEELKRVSSRILALMRNEIEKARPLHQDLPVIEGVLMEKEAEARLLDQNIHEGTIDQAAGW